MNVEYNTLADALNEAIRTAIYDDATSVLLTHHTYDCVNIDVDIDDWVECNCKSFNIPVAEAVSVGSDRLAEKMTAAFEPPKE